jgi:hypothetical protein
MRHGTPDPPYEPQLPDYELVRADIVKRWHEQVLGFTLSEEVEWHEHHSPVCFPNHGGEPFIGPWA